MNVMKLPSLIRVEADEVQYPLHILLRFTAPAFRLGKPSVAAF